MPRPSRSPRPASPGPAQKHLAAQANLDRAAAAVVAGAILAAPALLLGLEALPGLHSNHVVLGVTCTVVLFGAVGLAYLAFKWAGLQPKPLGIIWTFTAFTAAVDTVITPGLLGYHSVGNFYHEKGEKYVQSAIGAALFGWDGTFHFVVQTWLAFMTMTNRDKSVQYKIVALLWAGSIINSMQPYMLGAFTGPFSNEIQLSSILNLPYVFFPVWCAVKVIGAIPSRRLTLSQPVSIVFATLHTALACLHFVRLITAAGSQMPLALSWAKVEPVLVQDTTKHVFFLTAQWFFWFAPYHLVCALDLISPVDFLKRHATDFAALALGGYLNGLCFYCVGAAFDFDKLNAPLKRHSPAPPAAFWLINAGTVLFCLAYLLALSAGGD